MRNLRSESPIAIADREFEDGPVYRFSPPVDCSETCREEFVEDVPRRNRGARGAITGILLGAGLWTGILAAFGVIRL